VTDFRFKDEVERFYHDLGVVQPNEVRDLDEAPDYRWAEVQHKDSKSTGKNPKE
jgi:hypothetical protein